MLPSTIPTKLLAYEYCSLEILGVLYGWIERICRLLSQQKLVSLTEQCQQEDDIQLFDDLGITVAGYVSPDPTNNDAAAGIVIRDVVKNSVCVRHKRLVVGDQIVEINGHSLNGFSNIQTLHFLQSTSSSVQFKIRGFMKNESTDCSRIIK